MDSDDDTFDNVDSGNVSSGDDDFPIVDESETSSKDRQSEHDEYPYEGLTTEEIVQHMVDCIKEVNTVVEVRKNRQGQSETICFFLVISMTFRAGMLFCHCIHSK